MAKRFISLMVILLLLPWFTMANAFDPNKLVEDDRFSDIQTLGGVEGIQKFLESKNSVLANTSPEFLLKLREPDASLKALLPDPRPNLGRLRTAAELIYDASTSAGLNPQVVLVTLHKEQSLITGAFSEDRLRRALDRSLGFGCPDNGGCGDVFLGFYHQLFGNFDNEGNRYIGMPASLMRSFNFEVGGTRVGRGPMTDSAGNALGSSAKVRTSRVGDIIVLENTQGPPNNAPATQTVTLSNFATAALYRYTPHVYNGNYNFWKFFSQWFAYPNGTLLQTSDSTLIFVIDNGLKRQISNFVIAQRGLNASNIITVSPTELSGFPLGPVMLPDDGSLLQGSDGRVFIIENGTKKYVSSFVAAQRKLNLGSVVTIPDQEIGSYEDGGVALPAEGTLVKSSDSPAVYIITNSQKRLLTGFVFQQRGFKFGNVLTAQPGELDVYPTGEIMPPLDGTLIKALGEPAVYHVTNGVLRPLTLFVFNQRGFKFGNVKSVSKGEIDSWQKGGLMPPETGVLVKSNEDPTVYYMEAGVRRPVSFGVFKASRFDFKDVLLASQGEVAAFELGDTLPLPERALIKAEGEPAVYYVVDGVLRPLTLPAFQNRLLRFEDVVEIPAAELATYPIGAVVEN